MIINGNEYELKYSMSRVEAIEIVTGEPLMSIFTKYGGYLTISALKTYVAYGLKQVGAEHVSPDDGLSIAERLIGENGYADTNAWVMKALERDCPFFFRAV